MFKSIPKEYILPFFFFFLWAPSILSKEEAPSKHKKKSAERSYINLLSENPLHLNITKNDRIIADNILKTFTFLKKDYINDSLIDSTLKRIKKTKHFAPFESWLQNIKAIANTTGAQNIIPLCDNLERTSERLPLERFLEKKAIQFCQNLALQEISREIDQTKTFKNSSLTFFKKNLKHFLRLKKHSPLAFFIQQHKDKPNILQVVSDEISQISQSENLIPHHELLKEITIDQELTQQIQARGLHSNLSQNVFYAEFLKLLKESYRILNDDKERNEKQLAKKLEYIKNYIKLNKEHLPLDKTLTKLSYLTKSFLRKDLIELSRTGLDFILTFDKIETYEDALFYKLWTFISQDELKEAAKFVEKMNLMSQKKFKNHTILIFWTAYVLEKTNKKDESISLYQQLIKDHPLSYYAIMAHKKLLKLNPDSSFISFYSDSVNEDKIFHYLKKSYLDADYLSSLLRLKIWSKLRSKRMINKEIQRLNNYSIPHLVVQFPLEKQLGVKSDLHVLNAKMISSERNHLETFHYLYQLLNSKNIIFDKKVLTLLYPTPFINIIKKKLKNKSIDPLVVLSLIRQESVFNPAARSRVGARGLMQLMPQTARRFRRIASKRKLYNPDLNISIGTKYFEKLMNRYDGNLVYVLSAYNAGETRVKRWNSKYFDMDTTILKNIESIPFLETRKYVKLIFRNLFFYKLLLEKNDRISPSEDINKIYNVHLGFNN